ncbi:hypothetical protein GOP47_0014380 [Adiantum capillus-veneris]|uniref:Uncharacterized protein n=1 Tax=Adiantum capillus-veneris TaxID=13818 RepID=A0A9D4ULN2_ADICA|nr:hypothetical protein GOP47_0014380 [Adiantum capillus-veneris]
MEILLDTISIVQLTFPFLYKDSYLVSTNENPKLVQGTRKVVVAADIAEASLTIDGIYYVVGVGFANQNVYNRRLGLDSLVIMLTSQASTKQRAR